jgi:hypothetical protein
MTVRPSSHDAGLRAHQPVQAAVRALGRTGLHGAVARACNAFEDVGTTDRTGKRLAFSIQAPNEWCVSKRFVAMGGEVSFLQAVLFH